MSGSSCATTGSPIVSSGPTTTSLSTVATPGTNSSISLGPSCRSACATGPTGSDQRDSVSVIAIRVAGGLGNLRDLAVTSARAVPAQGHGPDLANRFEPHLADIDFHPGRVF